MKEVYRRFELGDSEGCLAILNSNDLDNEFKNWEILHEHQAKKKASIYIREHKLAIDILQTMYTYIDRFKEIDFRYREIVLTAEKYTIELKILFEYATFLESQNDYDNAFNIAHKLLSYYQKMINVTKYYVLIYDINHSIPTIYKCKHKL